MQKSFKMLMNAECSSRSIFRRSFFKHPSGTLPASLVPVTLDLFRFCAATLVAAAWFKRASRSAICLAHSWVCLIGHNNHRPSKSQMKKHILPSWHCQLPTCSCETNLFDLTFLWVEWSCLSGILFVICEQTSQGQESNSVSVFKGREPPLPWPWPRPLFPASSGSDDSTNASIGMDVVVCCCPVFASPRSIFTELGGDSETVHSARHTQDRWLIAK